jgi:hypothetical protein
MANRTLRSRTVEISEKGVEFTAGESVSDWPCDQPRLLGSFEEQFEATQTKKKKMRHNFSLQGKHY